MSIVSESVNYFLNESLGNLKEFDLPKDWKNFIIRNQGGENSEVYVIYAQEPYEIKRAFDKIDTLAIVIMEDGEWRYLITKESDRKYRIADKHKTKEWYEKENPGKKYYGSFGRGSRASDVDGFIAEVDRKSMEKWVNEINFNKAYVITKDKNRNDLYQSRYKNKNISDPLEVGKNMYGSSMSMVQKDRKEKYSKLKVKEIELKLEDAFKEVKENIIKNFDDNIAKNIENIKKGYSWYSFKNNFVDAILKNIDLDKINKYAELFSMISNDYKTAPDLAKELKKQN